MNADRRKRLEKAVGWIEDAKQAVEEVAGEEREAFENLPENMQSGEKGQAMSDAADKLDDVASELDRAVDDIRDSMEQ